MRALITYHFVEIALVSFLFENFLNCQGNDAVVVWAHIPVVILVLNMQDKLCAFGALTNGDSLYLEEINLSVYL